MKYEDKYGVQFMLDERRIHNIVFLDKNGNMVFGSHGLTEDGIKNRGDNYGNEDQQRFM